MDKKKPEIPQINLGQYPRRTYEDLRLQTDLALEQVDVSHFYTQPSINGNSLRALHSLLACFCRHLRRESQPLRCLAWGYPGDLVHVKKYLSEFNLDLDFHGVVSCEEAYPWALSQLKDNVWLETDSLLYAQPAAPMHYFNCVLPLCSERREYRRLVLSHARDYIKKAELYSIVSVDSPDDLLCKEFNGTYYQGSRVWRTHG